MGTVGSLSCFESVRVVGKWKIFENYLDLCTIALAKLLEGPTDPPAKWSLEIREFYDLDRCCSRTYYWIACHYPHYLSRWFEKDSDYIRRRS